MVNVEEGLGCGTDERQVQSAFPTTHERREYYSQEGITSTRKAPGIKASLNPLEARSTSSI